MQHILQEKNKKKSSMSMKSPFSILANILVLLVLDLAIILEHFSSHFNNIIIVTLLQLITVDTKRSKSPTSVIADPEVEPNMRLSIGEVQMVMERLGMECREQINYDEDELFFHGGLMGPDEIANVFVEQEPSLEEVKEAFGVFDKNGDGVIDAGELSKLLGAVGFAEAGESECKKLMRAFDENGDGVIDLLEFTKLVDKSLS